jgi:hypothetical protein
VDDAKTVDEEKDEDGEDADVRAAGIGATQEGAISLDQLGAAGLSVKQVRRRVRSHRLETTVARAVFRFPGAPPTWRQDLWVATLAGPPDTVVSHTSAAAAYGLLDPPSPPHVTVGRTSSGRKAGAVIHHATVGWQDRCRLGGLPATRIARTVVDCAALLEQDALNTVVDAAIGRGLTTLVRIRAAHERAGAVQGGPRLAEALAPYTAGVSPKSVKEAHVLRLFRQWGLPAPECQHIVRDAAGGFVAKIDFAWPPWRVGLEYDGDEFHPPRAWERDDARQHRIEALHWRIERADRFDLRPSSTRLRALLTRLLREPA